MLYIYISLIRLCGTCDKFGPTQLPVNSFTVRVRDVDSGLGLGPYLIDRKLGGPEPDTSADYVS